MEQACVTDIDFGSTDQSLFGIRGPWLEAAYQKQIHHDIQIPGYSVPANAKSIRELRGIEHLALIVRKHLPIAAQCFGRDTGAECGHIALKGCPDKGCPPCEAGVVIGSKKTVGKAAASPKTVHRRILDPSRSEEHT